MKFKFEIESGNAAFAEYPQDEVVRLLRLAAEEIEHGAHERWLRDYNGHKVGEYRLEVEN